MFSITNVINAKKFKQLLVWDVEGRGIKLSKVAWLQEGVIPTALFKFLLGECIMECRSGEVSRLEKHAQFRTHDLLTTKALIAF